MKKLAPFGVCLLVAPTATAADIVTLKDGRILNGTYLGGSSRELKFESGDRIQTLDVSAISSITPESMVHLLIDVVSKNGNLLLNIPLPGHGRPDDDEMSFLEKFGEWMALNSEAIYSTRLWKIAGEGPTKPGGSLYSGRGPRFTAEDIRFTTKADTLYAIAMGWPQDRKLVVRRWPPGRRITHGEIARVGLVGSESNLVWSRGAGGLTINLPEKAPCD